MEPRGLPPLLGMFSKIAPDIFLNSYYFANEKKRGPSGRPLASKLHQRGLSLTAVVGLRAPHCPHHDTPPRGLAVREKAPPLGPARHRSLDRGAERPLQWLSSRPPAQHRHVRRCIGRTAQSWRWVRDGDGRWLNSIRARLARQHFPSRLRSTTRQIVVRCLTDSGPLLRRGGWFPSLGLARTRIDRLPILQPRARTQSAERQNRFRERGTVGTIDVPSCLLLPPVRQVTASAFVAN